MWQDWLNAIIGVWLIIAGFIPGIVNSRSGNLWNALISGGLVLIFALWVVGKKPLEWVNVILGAWLVIAAFIPSIQGSTATWDYVIVGLLIAIFGIWAALAKGKKSTAAVTNKEGA